jgi:triosephosphate isomerase
MDPVRSEVAVFPPAPLLAPVLEVLAGSSVRVGAQNVHDEDQGAHTGEWSAPMLASLGCSMVIVGHSERRARYGDTDAWVSRKLRAAFRQRLRPILCVGETIQERDAGRVAQVLRTQLSGSLAGIGAHDARELTVAYEPVWAIGTGRTATPQQAEEAHRIIRDHLAGLYDRVLAESIRILYGGSVKRDNIDELLARPEIDGALIGGASLKAEDFVHMAQAQKGGVTC